MSRVDPNPDDPLEQLRRAIPPGAFLDRRLGRAFAFQALYEMDLAHHPPATSIARLGDVARSDSPYPPEVVAGAAEYAQQLVAGVLEHRSEIDALIHERAPLWPLAQMSAVDRNVLRIGLYESLYGSATVPLRAAINEAVELAKAFGSENSAKFVNGVLGRAVEATASGEEGRIADGRAVGQNAPAMPAPEAPADIQEERGPDHGHEL